MLPPLAKFCQNYKSNCDDLRKDLTQQPRGLERRSIEHIGKPCILTSGEHQQEDAAALTTRTEDGAAK